MIGKQYFYISFSHSISWTGIYVLGICSMNTGPTFAEIDGTTCFFHDSHTQDIFILLRREGMDIHDFWWTLHVERIWACLMSPMNCCRVIHRLVHSRTWISDIKEQHKDIINVLRETVFWITGDLYHSKHDLSQAVNQMYTCITLSTFQHWACFALATMFLVKYIHLLTLLRKREILVVIYSWN